MRLLNIGVNKFYKHALAICLRIADSFQEECKCLDDRPSYQILEKWEYNSLSISGAKIWGRKKCARNNDSKIPLLECKVKVRNKYIYKNHEITNETYQGTRIRALLERTKNWAKLYPEQRRHQLQNGTVVFQLLAKMNCLYERLILRIECPHCVVHSS